MPPPNPHIIIEACVDSVESAIAAQKGGADRLELNLALDLDGLTPSMGLFKEVKKAVSLPIIVMIRPRGYGFVYSDQEFATMQADIDAFLEAGIDGIAIGFLTNQLKIDQQRTRQVVNQIEEKECVFHRAFDVTPGMPEALEALIDCGVKRVLTSGQQPSALAGSKQLTQLIELADNRIDILPGAGIKPTNVAQLIMQTGCRQVHGTFKTPAASHSYHGLDSLRAPAPVGTSAEVVAQVRKAVDS